MNQVNYDTMNMDANLMDLMNADDSDEEESEDGFLEEEDDDDSAENGIIHVDGISVDATTRQVLESLQANSADMSLFEDYHFYLQGNRLVDDESIISQCKVVQDVRQMTSMINLKLKFSESQKRIEIVDILKPTDPPPITHGTTSGY